MTYLIQILKQTSVGLALLLHSLDEFLHRWRYVRFLIGQSAELSRMHLSFQHGLLLEKEEDTSSEVLRKHVELWECEPPFTGHHTLNGAAGYPQLRCSFKRRCLVVCTRPSYSLRIDCSDAFHFALILAGSAVPSKLASEIHREDQTHTAGVCAAGPCVEPRKRMLSLPRYWNSTSMKSAKLLARDLHYEVLSHLAGLFTPLSIPLDIDRQHVRHSRV